jgi:hypothetical protein
VGLSIPKPSDGAEVVLPCQYYDVSRGDRESGEQRLLFALLVDAINVYQRGALSVVPEARRLFVEAEQWVTARSEPGGPLSFVTVCEALGIEPVLLRQRLLEWKHTLRQHSPHSPGCLNVTPRLRNAGARSRRKSDNVFVPM